MASGSAPPTPGKIPSYRLDATRAAIREHYASMPAGDLVPPCQALEVDARGFVWIGEYLLPGEGARTYTIMDPEGRAAGRLTLPPRTSPLEIGRDYILAVTRDDLDVERVTLWELTRPAT